MDDVEHEHCDACGFDGSRYDDASLIVAIEGLPARWRTLLDDSGPELRTRPEPRTWSAIEYAAHSRDVTALHVFGVEQALTGDEPVFPVIDGGDLIDTSPATFAAEDVDTIAAQLEREAGRLRDVAMNATTSAWDRGITIGENRSTVRRLLEHALHDSRHHLDDVQQGLVIIRESDAAT